MNKLLFKPGKRGYTLSSPARLSKGLFRQFFMVSYYCLTSTFNTYNYNSRSELCFCYLIFLHEALKVPFNNFGDQIILYMCNISAIS